MTKSYLKIACAPLAIAAMAALHSIPATAQSQPQIVIDVPDTQPSTATEPTIVLPDPDPVVTDPVDIPSDAAATTTPAEEPVQAPTTTTSRNTTAASTAAPAPATVQASDSAPVFSAAKSADEAVSSTDTLPAVAGPLPSDTQLAVNRGEMAPVAPPVEDASTAALILALLGVGGAGLLALFLIRRRRREDVPVIEKPVVTKTFEPAPVLEREPAMTMRDEADIRTPSADHAPAMAKTVAKSNGAAVELPLEKPATYEERTSLMERMIAARPDRANPFRSPKARAKRARLIMQSIGTRFTARKPRIDLSQYTNIWPELRGWRPATA